MNTVQPWHQIRKDDELKKLLTGKHYSTYVSDPKVTHSCIFQYFYNKGIPITLLDNN